MASFGTFDTVVGTPAFLPVFLGTTTGVVIGDLVDLEVTQNGQAVLVPVTTLGLLLVEVDSANQPGMYALRVTPVQAGSLSIRFTYSTAFEYVVAAADAPYSDASLEGDYTATVNDGGGPVSGATVRVYDSAGTRLVQRGTTDASGEVVFYGLPVGNYQLRTSKDGYDFSSVNPTDIVVMANEETDPRLTEVLPTTASIGDVIALSGAFFDPDDTSVNFGAAADIAATYVNAAGTLLMVTIPAGLTDTVIALRVNKPDPANPTVDRLYSNVVTLVRT